MSDNNKMITEYGEIGILDGEKYIIKKEQSTVII